MRNIVTYYYIILLYYGTKPIMLRRYFDNYVDISTSTMIELDDFVQYFNDFHPSLSYTYDMSDTNVNFLNISISMIQHGVTTDIFYKETHTHSYLRYNRLIHHHVRKVFIIHSSYDYQSINQSMFIQHSKKKK